MSARITLSILAMAGALQAEIDSAEGREVVDSMADPSSVGAWGRVHRFTFSAMPRLQHRFRFRPGDAKEGAGDAFGAPVALFPVLQCRVRGERVLGAFRSLRIGGANRSLAPP